MTVNEIYLVVSGDTVTLNFISVMTPGLHDSHDTFYGTHETFPGHIRWFPGPFFIEIIIF